MERAEMVSTLRDAYAVLRRTPHSVGAQVDVDQGGLSEAVLEVVQALEGGQLVFVATEAQSAVAFDLLRDALRMTRGPHAPDDIVKLFGHALNANGLVIGAA